MSGSGQSSAPHRGTPTENFIRLCHLITTICTDILRDVLNHYIQPADLRSKLDQYKQKLGTIANVQQMELLFPANRNTTLTANDLDISVLYILLRYICNIPEHRRRWGYQPEPGDNSIAACIERIRIQKNRVLTRETNVTIEDADFQNRWAELQDAVVELEKQLIGGNLYARRVNDSIGTEGFVNIGRPPNDAQLEKVSRYIGSNYLLIGVALGLETRDIDRIDLNNYNVQTRIFRMLVAWRDTDGGATEGKLISVLTEFLSWMDVEKIRQMFQRTNANAT